MASCPVTASTLNAKGDAIAAVRAFKSKQRAAAGGKWARTRPTKTTRAGRGQWQQAYDLDFILRKLEEPRTAPVEHLRPRRNSDVAVRKALDGRGLARARAEGHRAAEVPQPDTEVPGVAACLPFLPSVGWFIQLRGSGVL